MQRIKIANNEFKGWSNDKYIVEPIYDKKNGRIRLGGLTGILRDDKSDSRQPSDDLKLKFVKWYIDKKRIKVCPYCGKNYLAYFCNEIYKRNYGNYKKGDCKPRKVISGFDIEHFFPKNYKDKDGRKPYAQLAKDLYNWHLSCTICNQRLKKNKDVMEGASRKDSIFNPYFGWLYKDGDGIKVKDFTFDEKVTFVGDPNLRLDDRKQIYQTYHGKFFRLGEIYLKDQETYNIFNFIYTNYTKIKDEYCRFKSTSKTIEEFIDYFFKNYYPEKEQDILKYNNGKFKKDLIEYVKKILEEQKESGRLCGKEERKN